jgi:hypothetical protein
MLLAKIRSASPIRRDKATGNRKNELYRETAGSNWKYTVTSIARMPDYSWITVVILTPLILRYILPLIHYSELNSGNNEHDLEAIETIPFIRSD